MQKLHVEGGRPLSGRISISGAKNAALPAIAASLLTSESVRLRRLPDVVDIRTMSRLLENIGSVVRTDAKGCEFQAPGDPRADSAVRAGQDDAGFESGARSACRALRTSPCLSPWRLRDRLQADRHAPRRAQGARSHGAAGQGLHRGSGASGRAGRRSHSLPQAHGDRNRGPAHGGCPRQGRERAGEWRLASPRWRILRSC